MSARQSELELSGDRQIALALIVAVADNGVIGHDGGLPWHQSSDLKRFRRLTLDKPIVMGRKTYAAIGKPLDGRDNIVISRDPGLQIEGVVVVTTIDAALTAAQAAARRRQADEVMVIGGAQIYAELLPRADRVYLTRIHCAPSGDARFPELDPATWRPAHQEALPQGERDDWPATLTVFERIVAA